MVDAEGTEQACGGLYATLRDMARFGELIRNNGRILVQEVVPKAVIDNIRSGGDRKLFASSSRSRTRPGFSYHDQWWITHNRLGAIEANGLYGQRVYIAPEAEMVIVQFSSHPGHSDETAASFAAISEKLADQLNYRI